jgi:hypothetical protein
MGGRHVTFTVTEGVFDFWFGPPNANGSWHMHGEINSDGTAYFEQTGLTGGNPRSSPQGPGKPYQVHVPIKLTDKQGFGIQGGNLRPREWTFTRQN